MTTTNLRVLFPSTRPVSVTTVLETPAMGNSLSHPTLPQDPILSFGIGFSTEMLLLEEKSTPPALM